VSGLAQFQNGLRVARTGSPRPYIEMYSSESFATRQASIVGADTGLELLADAGPVRLFPNGSEAARVDGANALFGKAASNFGAVGIELAHTVGRVAATLATANMNVLLNHVAAADANAVMFAQFQRAGIAIGSITQVSTTGVAFNTTSDERLKDVLGPIDDPLGVIAALNPVHYAWKETGEEQDGFIAHEVQAVVPWAVTGERGAVHPAPPLITVDVTDPDGNPVRDADGSTETTEIPDPSYPPEGSIDPQQLDVSKLVPVLVAAVQALAARVAVLEGAGT